MDTNSSLIWIFYHYLLDLLVIQIRTWNNYMGTFDFGLPQQAMNFKSIKFHYLIQIIVLQLQRINTKLTIQPHTAPINVGSRQIL
jgi:hypothetical protein